MEDGATGAGFQTTQWSLLDGLDAADPGRQREAADRLATLYWPAVYGWLRRSGQDSDRAADTTQGFFTDVIYGRRLFERSCPERGRLRTMILVALGNYVVDRHRRAHARRSEHHVTLDAIDAEELALSESDDSDAGLWFDRRWAAAVLEEAMRRCEQYYRRVDRIGHWLLLEQRVLHPAIGSTRASSLRDIAAKLGFADERAAASALQVAKRRVLALVHEVVAESAGEQAQDEQEFVLSLLS